MRIYYFGCWSGDRSDGGHFVYTPDRGRLRLAGSMWALAKVDAIDGLFVGSHAPQSECVLVRIINGGDGWTIVQCADYTGDSRPGGNSALIAESIHTFAEMRALWKQRFPAQFERIEKAGALRMRGST